MHYVIGDVHGCYTALLDLIRKIELDDPDYEIIFTGDLIDRGPEVDKILKFSMKKMQKENLKFRSVRGNHEQYHIEWYKNAFLPWVKKGRYAGTGEMMPESKFDFSLWMEEMDCLEKMQQLEGYINLFDEFPYSIDLDIDTIWRKRVKFKIVHASYDFTLQKEDGQQHYVNLYSRNHLGHDDMEDIIVIHGHTPTFLPNYIESDKENTRPGFISYRRNMINVDGGYVIGRYFGNIGFLSGICLESLKEYYSCSIEERLRQTSTVCMDDEVFKVLSEDLRRIRDYQPPYRKDILKKMGFI